MVVFNKNANRLIHKAVFEDSVRTFYLSTCEDYSNNFRYKFATDMQNLVTKLGIMLSDNCNGPQVSYCYTSLKFLCYNVLDDSKMFQKFDKLKLNSNGNNGKHTISTSIDIDIKKIVDLYNDMIKQIIKKYKIDALKDMIVVKKIVKKGENKVMANNRHRPPSAIGATDDPKVKLYVQIEQGNGRYKKGIFKKTNYVNFNLNVRIENKEVIKIKHVEVIIKSGSNTFSKKLPCTSISQTEFDIPASNIRGNIQATVIVEYKFGLFKSKQIKSTVSKQF